MVVHFNSSVLVVDLGCHQLTASHLLNGHCWRHQGSVLDLAIHVRRPSHRHFNNSFFCASTATFVEFQDCLIFGSSIINLFLRYLNSAHWAESFRSLNTLIFKPFFNALSVEDMPYVTGEGSHYVYFLKVAHTDRAFGGVFPFFLIPLETQILGNAVEEGLSLP